MSFHEKISVNSKNRTITKSSPATNNYLESEDSDEFGESACGEPLREQYLVLDFTPTDEDTDYIQKKCCAFWDFINSQPELQNLAPKLDSEITDKLSESGDFVSLPDKPETSAKINTIEKTAVSMLELVEEKGLIDRAFEARLPTSQCSLGLRDYLNDEKFSSADEGGIMYATGDRVGSVKSLKNKRRKDSTAPSSPTLRALCQKLQEWDLEHPKSMEPPGPPPV